MPDNWTPSTRFARAWRSAFVCLCLAGTALLPAAAQADARSQAKRIHDRLAGVPPTEAVLTSMAGDIVAGRETEAAYTAMQHRAFYDVTLKNFAMPWTNRDQTVFTPLNDFVATVIGMVPKGQMLEIDPDRFRIVRADSLTSLPSNSPVG